MRTLQWRQLPVTLTELCLDTTLRCGQSFRWRKSDDDVWSCALHGRILSLRQDSMHLHYHATFPQRLEAPPTPPSSAPDSIADDPAHNDDTEALVYHYLNLAPDLTGLYNQWSTADANFKKKAPKFAGVRILRQDAWEALVGFICSSNNNILRISQMMEKLCVHYGPLIGHFESKPYYDMPSSASLSNPKVEAHLRELGFGYRAKYLYQTAVLMQQHESGWLDGLRNPESPTLGRKMVPAGEMLSGGRKGYRTAHEELLALQGVGPKVADCVCLMGLGWGEAVPVDTHVWQIAQRDYKFGKGKHRSFTKATYDAVGDHFRNLWGKEAGWAHSVLFAADLRAFSSRLNTKVEAAEAAEAVAVKKEEDEKVMIATRVQREKSTARILKREIQEDEPATMAVEHISTTRKAKRRRKG